MCEYPVRYRMKDNFIFKNNENRKRSLFMAGDVDKKEYGQIEKSRFLMC